MNSRLFEFLTVCLLILMFLVAFAWVGSQVPAFVQWVLS
jgi:hypothetical protein